MSGYYRRYRDTYIDGSPVFQTEDDRRSEDRVAAEIARAFNCEMHRFGTLAPVDWYAVRYGRVTGVLELKAGPALNGQTVDAYPYPHVWLNMRKWCNLTLHSLAMGVPALFVVAFVDLIKWIRVDEIDTKNFRLGGCKTTVKAVSDREPVIVVPVAQMTVLRANIVIIEGKERKQ